MGVISRSFTIMTFTLFTMYRTSPVGRLRDPQKAHYYRNSALGILFFLILAILCIFACVLYFGCLFLVSANFKLRTIHPRGCSKGCYLRLSSVTFTAQGALLRVTRTKTKGYFNFPCPTFPDHLSAPLQLLGHTSRTLCVPTSRPCSVVEVTARFSLS